MASTRTVQYIFPYTGQRGILRLFAYNGVAPSETQAGGRPDYIPWKRKPVDATVLCTKVVLRRTRSYSIKCPNLLSRILCTGGGSSSKLQKCTLYQYSATNEWDLTKYQRGILELVASEFCHFRNSNM